MVGGMTSDARRADGGGGIAGAEPWPDTSEATADSDGALGWGNAGVLDALFIIARLVASAEPLPNNDLRGEGETAGDVTLLLDGIATASTFFFSGAGAVGFDVADGISATAGIDGETGVGVCVVFGIVDCDDG